jgi:hypothetical protein
MEDKIESRIETALIEADITDTKIAGMKDKYFQLSVEDKEDNVGFQAVTTARKEVKSFRVSVEKFAKELRTPATLFQKAVISKEKEIVGKITEIEDYLISQEEIFNPKEVVSEKELTDEEKFNEYIISLLKVKIPEIEDENVKTKLQEVIKFLNSKK